MTAECMLCYRFEDGIFCLSRSDKELFSGSDDDQLKMIRTNYNNLIPNKKLTFHCFDSDISYKLEDICHDEPGSNSITSTKLPETHPCTLDRAGTKLKPL